MGLFHAVCVTLDTSMTLKSTKHYNGEINKVKRGLCF